MATAAQIPPRRSPWPAVFRLIRPYQWVKNLLVFMPLLLGHVLPGKDARAARQWEMAAAAFAAFCLAASAVYVVNDRLDVEADRLHPQKRHRPFASGDLSVRWAWPLATILLLAAATISLVISVRFAAVLALYAGVGLLYSRWLKSRVLVDVFVLAGLYTLRLIAGDRATGVPLSPWLLAFSTFLFVSLAFAKRYAELLRFERAGLPQVTRRGYVSDDLRILEVVGPTSGYLAVMVLALYISDASSAAGRLYREPFFLWLMCPLLMYWVTRIWLISRRNGMDADPILFAVRDRVSWFVMLIAAVLAVAAWQPWAI